MDELLHYSRLFDIYGQLLTVKQAAIFGDYYFDNLTIEEIAENRGVSKNAISKTIKAVKVSLDEYEASLKLEKYIDSIKNEFKNEEDILRRIDKYDNIIL